SSHREEERLDPGFHAGAPVPVTDQFQIALPSLVRDRHPWLCGRQPRRRLHQGHVDRVRALRAAKDEYPCRPWRRTSIVMRLLVAEKFRTYVIPRHERLAGKERHALLVGD